MKVKLSATVPVVQYGNLVPEVEVEAETYEEAMRIAEGHIKSFWNKNVEAGKELADDLSNYKRLTAFVGGEIDYDESTHTYVWEGVKYISGSEYADSFKKPFDGQAIAQKMAEKVNVEASDILKMWQLKGEASRDFGNSIHKALQLYEQYKTLAETLDKTYHMHDNFILKDVVESFYEAHSEEKAVSEILIVDHDAKRAGRIDRLLVTGINKGRVEDFKTGDVSKNILTYWKQLEFYTEIMIAAGWKMEPPIIHGWNGKWEIYAR